MQSKAFTVEDYLNELPDERRESIIKLRNVIKKNIPEGFEESMQYGMITYVVPHSIYPAGYHCKPSDALPFVSIASQKNFVAVYHMVMYGKPEISEWFKTEYQKFSPKKLDAGKSCTRFKKVEDIPFDLIGELVRKISVEDYITFYELTFKNNKKSK